MTEFIPAQPVTSIAPPKRPIGGVRVGGAAGLLHPGNATKSDQEVAKPYRPSINDLLMLSPPDVNRDTETQPNRHQGGGRSVTDVVSGRVETKAYPNARSVAEQVPVPSGTGDEGTKHTRRQLFVGDDESVRSERSASRERGRQSELSYGQKYEVERERSSSRNRNRGHSAGIAPSANGGGGNGGGGGGAPSAGKDKIISKANQSKREERHNAARHIQRMFRGYRARLNAWKRRELLNQVDRYVENSFNFLNLRF